MKNPYIIPAAMISAAILAGFWMLKPPPKAPDISIHEAAAKGDIEAVKQHLAADTDVNAMDVADGIGGLTPLHVAALDGHKEIAELLIAEGAYVNAKNKRGTPLHYAALSGHMEIVELLIAEGADVNAQDDDGWTPLHWPAGRDHKEIVELLIAAGADVNVKDVDGGTPLDHTVIDDHKETADLLRKHGGKTGEELKAAGN